MATVEMPQPMKVEKGKAEGIEDKKEQLDEDEILKAQLNTLVEHLQAQNSSLYKSSLVTMAELIRASTTSMTSVPKPLKFMRPHYDTMKQIHKKMEQSGQSNDVVKLCAEIISVLAMTMGTGKDCLMYRMMCDKHDKASIGDWGHEYVRHLSSEISVNWPDSSDNFKTTLIELVHQIIPYDMELNAEAEACDLLMEVEKLEFLDQYVDENAYPRVCLYLQSCVPYVAEPENTNLLKAGLRLSRKFNQPTQAMLFALALNDMKLIKEIFMTCPDPVTQKQLAFMLGRQQIFLELPETFNDYEVLTNIMSNTELYEHFQTLARELDIMEPKTPSQIFKSHLDESKLRFGQIDSAKQNLAASFVNGFVNAGFGTDKLLTENGNQWLFKNKDHGMFSTAASMGLIHKGNIEIGLTHIDAYLYSTEDNIKAGALLAYGILCSGIRHEVDPAMATLRDYVSDSKNNLRIAAILGLGLAYSGSNRQDVIQLITPVFKTGASNEIMGISALALGLISVGSCNSEVSEILVQSIMELTEEKLCDTFSKYIFLGLGLVFLGRQEAAEAAIAALGVIDEPHKSTATVMVEICAYAGTGNVLKIQRLLHICSEHHEPTTAKDSKEDRERDLSECQAVAVLGIALIALGEELGSEMALRSFGNLIRYCEPSVRRAIPLALGLISVSNTKLHILDMLSKFSHDNDSEVSLNAIFAMGLVGGGTNNARLALMLRNLAQYYEKDSNNLFMIRIAQGLTHLGKGTMTLSSYHSDRQLMCPVALAGVLGTLVAFLDVKNTIMSSSHYLLYSLTTAMKPKMLYTLDENLNQLSIQVRVGNAVDVVGQAGKPKTITGFQTHMTPVLLGMGERAELATEEYLPLTPVLEGFVILKKNPEYKA